MNTAAYVRNFSLKQAKETVQKDQRTGTLVTLLPISAEQWVEVYPNIGLFPQTIVPFGNAVVIRTTWLVKNLTDEPEFQSWEAAQTDPADLYSYFALTMPCDLPFGRGDYEPCIPL